MNTLLMIVITIFTVLSGFVVGLLIVAKDADRQVARALEEYTKNKQEERN